MRSSSSEADLSDWGQQDMRIIKKMTISKHLSDKRFLNLYKIRRAMWTLGLTEASEAFKSIDIDEKNSILQRNEPNLSSLVD